MPPTTGPPRRAPGRPRAGEAPLTSPPSRCCAHRSRRATEPCLRSHHPPATPGAARRAGSRRFPRRWTSARHPGAGPRPAVRAPSESCRPAPRNTLRPGSSPWAPAPLETDTRGGTPPARGLCGRGRGMARRAAPTWRPPRRGASAPPHTPAAARRGALTGRTGPSWPSQGAETSRARSARAWCECPAPSLPESRPRASRTTTGTSGPARTRERCSDSSCRTTSSFPSR